MIWLSKTKEEVNIALEPVISHCTGEDLVVTLKEKCPTLAIVDGSAESDEEQAEAVMPTNHQ